MKSPIANCPIWLEKRLKRIEGKKISFAQYMDWSLNDSVNGAYSTGRLRIGKKGDFATSPSLGFDFAELLAIQLIDWFEQFDKENFLHHPLTLVDIGPGEGDLARDLLKAIEKESPTIYKKLEVILIEQNVGMARRQKLTLQSISDVPISWKTFDELLDAPVLGIVIAHELLDALPVERLVYKNNTLFRQGVELVEHVSGSSISFVELTLSEEIKSSLEEIEDAIGLKIPPDGTQDGWCSEWHLELNSWFEKTSRILEKGALLIVDYVLEAIRYYNARKSSGTLMAYRNNIASDNILKEAGLWDLTSHLCMETLCFYARKNNWDFLGEVKQGEALLALGLSGRLHSLNYLPKENLAVALERRENLLRLVDPSGLGGFRWIAFHLDKGFSYNENSIDLKTRFLEEPRI